MKLLSKKIFKTLEKELEEVPTEINREIPDYKEIEDYKQAKETMKTFLEGTISKVETHIDSTTIPETVKVINTAKEILEDPKFLAQKGVRSLIDQEARVGHKSKTSHFFGYKTEFIITTEDCIITAVHTWNGAYVDGTNFNKLLELTKKSGVAVNEIYGDKAYFRKCFLDTIKKYEAIPYIPVSEMAYKINEVLYGYNKDSDEWFCGQGNSTNKKKYLNKKDRQSVRYYFEKEKCRNCPFRLECIPIGNTIGKVLEVSVNTLEFYEYSQQQNTAEFREKYKKRVCQAK